jgi:hypothetical protein
MARRRLPGAFSSEVETGSRKENASKQESGALSVSIPSKRKGLQALAERPGRDDIPATASATFCKLIAFFS